MQNPLVTSRTCNKCHLDFPLSQFYPHPKGRDGRRTACKSCCNAYCREWKRRNVDKVAHARRQAVWRGRNFRSVKDTKLRASYGIGLTQYEQMLENQQHGCAICGEPETRTSNAGGRRVLCVDHCHDTGYVRGLLCARCNSAIGHMRDDPALLRVAAYYLEKHMAAAMAVA